ncbi:hypothetical protein DPEC_G00069060 [Dallia pectoralis]|uniref:Uncharacterized protein n=1 Tax=Dallia pectoralis TaxID=75939 RepID=A0ACC2H1R7_DALPE|nr:hypothetical protein DPEC_G00069060 [Dallia pectoralis]
MLKLAREMSRCVVVTCGHMHRTGALSYAFKELPGNLETEACSSHTGADKHAAHYAMPERFAGDTGVSAFAQLTRLWPAVSKRSDDFVSLMLRYPMVPQLAVDTKECPECYFENRDHCRHVGGSQEDNFLLPLHDQARAVHVRTERWSGRHGEELEAPRYLSAYPLRCLYQYYGSLNRSLERAQRLAAVPRGGSRRAPGSDESRLAENEPKGDGFDGH